MTAPNVKTEMVIGGASGLIGGRLARALRQKGVRVQTLIRPQSKPSGDRETITWDPRQKLIPTASLENLEAVIHLGGENVASGAWTKARKQRIRSSRIETTTFLSETLASLNRPPRVLLCASATGYYGDRQDDWVDEDSHAGKGFLADVCRQWETATVAAAKAGIRVVHLRTGVVLAREGGALAKMKTPFQLGLGGVVGNGAQYMSWIDIDDLIEAVLFCLEHKTLVGPVNLVAPNPVTNREFTKTLGRVLGRPTILPLPSFIVNLLMGEMGRELLLAGARVRCKKLLEAGFSFARPELESALAAQLK